MSAPAPGTPLPWRLSDDVSCAMVQTDEADICEMQEWPFEIWAEQQANAAYIVHAANCFPELVEALAALLAKYESKCRAFDCPVASGAREALAKAGVQ